MSEQGTHSAFFYGTLMAPEVLYRVCDAKWSGLAKGQVERLTVQPALLRDYCRHRVSYCDYPGMIPEKGKAVRGTYVTGLTDLDVMRLDIFEGSQYERTNVEIELLDDDKDGKDSKDDQAGGTTIKHTTQTYVFTDEENLEKGEWDFEEFRRDKLHHWASTGDEYREVDESVENGAGHDPTGGRGVKAASTADWPATTDDWTASGGVDDEVLKSAV